MRVHFFRFPVTAGHRLCFACPRMVYWFCLKLQGSHRLCSRAQFEGIIKPNLLSHNFVDEEKESPEKLSPSAREFLASRGIALQENFAETAYSISFSAYCEAYDSFPEKMDWQIIQTARAGDIPVAALDDRSKTADDLLSDSGKILSSKPVLEIDSRHIEENVNAFYGEVVESYKAAFHKGRVAYLEGNLIYQPDGFWAEMKEKVLTSLVNLFAPRMKIMLKDRNELWLKKLLKALDGRTEKDHIFLAGGVSHFAGHIGLPALLKDEGFSIRPVTCSEEEY